MEGIYHVRDLGMHAMRVRTLPRRLLGNIDLPVLYLGGSYQLPRPLPPFSAVRPGC